MLKHNYGLTPKEDALISFLIDKEVDFVPLFYNSAIPIKELFYYFVIAGNSFYDFNRIPSLFTEFQNFNIVLAKNAKVDDLQQVRRMIRSTSATEGMLINISNYKNTDMWEYIKAEGRQFLISNATQKIGCYISALQLRKMYGGEIVRLRLQNNKTPSYEQLFGQRLFRPEQYIPFYFVESDLNSIEDLHSKLSSLFYAYRVTRYRMIQYYANFIDVEFLQDSMKKVESVYKLFNCLKNSANMKSKCFALLHELNEEDVLIMSQLKEKLGEKK